MRLTGIRKIFLLGDLHLGIKNNSIEWIQIQKEFLLDFFLSKVDEDFDETRDILILEGDVFHSRESINVRVQNEALEIFKTLSNKFKRGVFIIVGNHDVYYKDKNEVNSLKSISLLSDNIHVFEKPEVLSLNQHNFLMLPWMERTEQLVDVIRENSVTCQYIVCHADVKGLRFNRWTKVEHGLDINDLKDYVKVYAGHIHHRQETGNVLYTGTPYQMDRGDRDNIKGFYVLDATGKQVIESFVPNTKSPMYKKYDMYQILEMSVDRIKEEFDNAFVDIMVSINIANKVSITRLLELISGSTHRKIEFFTYVEEKEAVASIDFNPEDKFNVIDIFKAYLKSKDYSKAYKMSLAKNFVDLHKKVKQNEI